MKRTKSSEQNVIVQNRAEEKSTKERILDVSIDLFSKKGFESVSVREITGEVGIRESSLYNHFKSKDEIFDTIFAYFMEELGATGYNDQDIDQMLDRCSLEGFFEASGMMFMERMKDQRMEKIWRIITIELYRNPKMRQFFLKFMIQAPIDYWALVFKKMMDRKMIRKHDPEALANEYFSFAIYMYVEYFMLRYDEYTYDTFILAISKKMHDHVQFFLKAVKA